MPKDDVKEVPSRLEISHCNQAKLSRLQMHALQDKAVPKECLSRCSHHSNHNIFSTRVYHRLQRYHCHRAR